MQRFFRPATLLLAAALSLGSASLPSAQGLPGGASSLNETHGDWRVTCQSANDAVRCAISQTQVRGEDRQRVLAMELSTREGNTAAGGALLLPFGLNLDAGITPAIDDAAPLPAWRFATCLPQGCLVTLDFDAATVSALRTGTALQLRAAAHETGQEVAFSISLSGFGSALDRLAELTGS